jgi:phosphomannomutase
MVSISGVRGIVGESLTPEVVVRYTAALAQYCDRGRIVVGRDGRITGGSVNNLVVSTLLSMGCDVVDLGVSPTPTIEIAVEQLHAAAGIAVTASHNNIEWNGLKFIGGSGMFLNAAESRRLWDFARESSFAYVAWDRLGKLTQDDSFIRQHDDMVMNLPLIDAEQIRRRQFTVVVDCINAAGGLIVPNLLSAMGCRVIEMNCDVSGVFARNPEPVPENLGELCRRVRDEKADIGIAVDPDVDRLVLITEKGEPFGEEYTITAVVNFVLAKHAAQHFRGNVAPAVVVNLSTTRAVDDVAKRFSARVIRTPVGEINVAQKMKDCGALVGGEGSGGVILPALHFGRDAVVGIGIILQQMAEFSGKLSGLKASLPQYTIVKSKIPVGSRDADELLMNVHRRHAGNGNANTDDGLKLDFADGWVHLRKSNTEPIIRIIAEGKTAAGAQEYIDRFKLDLLEA